MSAPISVFIITFVVTPNTDHFLRWQREPSFRRLYAGADLVTTDGAPLAFLARLEGINVRRITGAELGSDAWLFCTAAQLSAYPGKLVALCLGSPKQERMSTTFVGSTRSSPARSCAHRRQIEPMPLAR